MNDKIVSEALTFDDVAVIPGISDIPSASVSTKINITKKIELEIPLLSAAMDTVTELDMALAMAKLGGLGVVHRNLKVEDQAEIVNKFKKTTTEKAADYKKDYIAAAIGTSGDFLKRSEFLVNNGVDLLVIDLAHGSTKWCVEAIREIKKKIGDISIMAGNVVTSEGAKYLASEGVDAIKVGIGGGSICTTRVVTGVGVPNVTAILDVKKGLEDYKEVGVVIDGGVRFSGDVVKSIIVGSDAAMCGSFLAGTDESPGEVYTADDGQKYKDYRGMSVKEAINKKTRDRYYTKQENVHTSQGVSAAVPYKGSVLNLVQVFMGGVKSGMENVGAKNIKELQDKGKLCKVTNAGANEAHVHDVKMVKKELNYSGR